MADRALSFGANAAGYDRYRLSYPVEVVDRIRAYATAPLVRAIEIGAGTGKATTVVAGGGIDVTAVEPDPVMLGVLVANTAGLEVTPVRSTFEAVGTPAHFDLLYAAAAWHWTDPETRWTRAAALVRAGGTVAFFGGPMEIADDDVRGAVVAARRALVPEDEIPSPGECPAEDDLEWPGTELLESELFTDVEQQVMPRRPLVRADDYVGHLSTVSAYLQLQGADRDEVLRRVRAVLPPEVEMRADITLHLARRV